MHPVEGTLTAATVGHDVFRRAAAAAVRDARPLEQNAFKVPLAAHSIVRALTLAAARGGG
jgi:xanthine dehydrogenase YagS FAD-binding subunit